MSESGYDFRKRLVEMVKASGQEVIDRAEELVGDGDLITDFDIWLRFPISIDDYAATIEVTRSHLSRKAMDVLFDERGKKKCGM